MNPRQKIDFSRAPILDPQFESKRLKALYSLGVLDTNCEERFDRITKLAAHFFQVPISYVALIDSDRQWFKSRQGLCVMSTSREVSFCQYTIQFNEPMVLHDTHLHETARNHPLVVGDPFLRFYAGIPLSGPENSKIGTFCLADIRPRDFVEKDIRQLQAFAQLVERELNLGHIIRTQNELIEAREALHASQNKLAQELSEASRYIRSMISPPLREKVHLNWIFQPSSLLGGDGLGYRIIDEDKIGLYVIDVTGHGIGSALVAVTILEFMRSHDGRDLDFSRPSLVLERLNHIFRMENHNGKFLCAWYGVYSRSQQTLTYANAGNPPAALIKKEGDHRTLEMTETGDFILGVLPVLQPREITISFAPGTELLLFTDGVYELEYASGERGDLEDFTRALDTDIGHHVPPFKAVENWLRLAGDKNAINDDVSLIHFKAT